MSYNCQLNSLVEIALVSSVLGAVFCTGLMLILVVPLDKYFYLVLYLVILTVYHLNEFYCTCRYQPTQVTSRSFLIYGNKGNGHFWFMQLLSIWEYLLQRSNLARNYGINIILGGPWGTVLHILGGFLVFSGISIRHLAMRTCGSSFNHHIQTKSAANHVLVTHGIYHWCRHPSYLGFWLFAVGIEVLLQNWLNLIANVFILGHFFTVRIQFEEWFLIHKIFGPQYIEYRRTVGLWIPLVRLKDET